VTAERSAELLGQPGERRAEREVKTNGRVLVATVGPWLTMAIGLPFLAAWRTKRSPDITVRDEPSTSRARASSTWP